MPDLLLELFSEEIPARMQARAAADLERAVNKALLDAGFMPEGVKAFAGPRRLTLIAAGLPGRQPDRREEKKGPRVGAPEKAVEGFLKSAGLSSLDECEKREDKKGAYWVAVIDRKGRETAALIAEFMPEIVKGFPWPKSMRWGEGELRWVRPLHRILCAFDGEITPFEVDGVKSSDVTEGHRFMAPVKIQARSFENYERDLREAKVLIDAEERKELIARDAETLCKAQGFELVEDQGLLNEVAGLAEWPVVMMGAFDEKFLTLPDEVLTASMRGHQKYFSVRDPKTGRLANKFVFVANLEAPDGCAAMRVGYERVLTARLSDAWYLYNQDLKTPLAERIADLDKVTFFEGLGSVGDKARRIAALAKEIAPAVGADPETAERAAMLAKADLVTGMVYEFPELQGVMGRYYHLAQSGLSSPIHGGGGREAAGGGEGANTPSVTSDKSGATATPAREGAQTKNRAIRRGVGEQRDRAIADAIRDHYKPAGQDDEVPTAPVSVAVALADKIDTLTAFWAIDKKPTGSSDPFALRRAALGVIQLVLSNTLRLSLRNLVYAATVRLVAKEQPLIHQLSMAINVYEQIDLIVDNNIPHLVRRSKTANEPEAVVLGPFSFPFSTFVYELFARMSELKNLEFGQKELIGRDHKLYDFFHDRLKVYLRDKGHRYDHIDAVLTDAEGDLQDDLVLIVAKLEALEAFLKTDDGANLAAAYKRAANILKAEEKNDKKAADPDAVEESALQEKEEKALYAALKNAEAKAAKAVAGENFEGAMSALAALRAPVDAFFDNVIVNADDPKLRSNRLSLLARLRAATATVADFSKLEG